MRLQQQRPRPDCSHPAWPPITHRGAAAACDLQEEGRDLKRAIGLVWQGCDAAAKAGLDNKGALFKGLAGVMAVLKDTLREVGNTGRAPREGACSSRWN
jgi:hypothetical protein